MVIAMRDLDQITRDLRAKSREHDLALAHNRYAEAVLLELDVDTLLDEQLAAQRQADGGTPQ